MLAFPGMVLAPAEKAGIKTPEDPDEYNPNEFPHFYIFCKCQLGRRMPWPTAHWENAQVIASIPEDKIKEVTFEQVLLMGFV